MANDRYINIHTRLYSKKACDIISYMRDHILELRNIDYQTEITFFITTPSIAANGEVILDIDKEYISRGGFEFFYDSVYYLKDLNNTTMCTWLADSIINHLKTLSEIKQEKVTLKYPTTEIEYLCALLSNNKNLETLFDKDMILSLLGQEHDPIRTEFEKIKKDKLDTLKKELDNKIKELNDSYRYEVKLTNYRHNNMNSIDKEIQRIEETNLLKKKYNNYIAEANEKHKHDCEEMIKTYDKQFLNIS